MELKNIDDVEKLREAIWGGGGSWAGNPYFFFSLFVLIPATLVVGYAAVVVIARKLTRANRGLPRMQEVHEAIAAGARAYLAREARYLYVTLAVLGVPVSLTGWSLHSVPALGVLFSGVIFLVGASSSFLAGYTGMRAATLANVRVVMAVRDGTPNDGFKMGYHAGAITGILNIVNFILGIWIIFLLTNANIYLMISYDFGASVTALFAQVGGGIFTKSADVGADLLGKLDLGIPEDDPRNPAVIADNVGDNVGDCAGRGADFFESASSEVVGGFILGIAVFIVTGNPIFILVDMTLIATGVFSTLACMKFLDVPLGDNPSRVVWVNFLAAMGINVVLNFTITVAFLGPAGLWLFLASLFGLLSSIFTVFVTIHFTDIGHKPTKRIMDESRTGPATSVLSGLSVGFRSTFFPVLIFSATFIVAGLCGYAYAELARSALISAGSSVGETTITLDVFGNPVSPVYFDFIFVVWGINTASASASMMIGVILSFDTFGPIVDNAAGISEMAGDETTQELRDNLDLLDATGNTTKAIAKGYALLCAGFASVVLFQNYLFNLQTIGPTIGGNFPPGTFDNVFTSVQISNPILMLGVVLGISIPFIFSSYCLSAVSEGATVVVKEARHQYYLAEAQDSEDARPDYKACVDIATTHAIKRMILPVALIVGIPLLTGLFFGPFFIAALLVGNLAGCLVLGISFSISGGAMDNAKKGIESGIHGGKGSVAHKASVIGDTVGDPLKDTAGPSMNIVLTTINTLALTFLPLFVLTAWLSPFLQMFSFI
ncbi:MAG: sodium-translocating pyrophosphatase [Promethearchaeota archaeon]